MLQVPDKSVKERRPGLAIGTTVISAFSSFWNRFKIRRSVSVARDSRADFQTCF